MAAGKLRRFNPNKKKGGLNKVQKREVAQLANQNRLKRSEWKRHVVGGTINASTAGFFQSLTDLPQGDTDITRDGDQVEAYTVDLRYYAFTQDATNLVRVILFQWVPNTAIATPTLADILLNAGTYDALAPYETDNHQMWKILYDRTHSMAQTGAASANVTKLIRKKIKVSRKKVQFEGGTTDGTNKVYMLVISDSGVANHPGITYVARVNYLDN